MKLSEAIENINSFADAAAPRQSMSFGDLVAPKQEASAQPQLSEAAAAGVSFLKLLDPNGWHNLVRIHPETKQIDGETFAPGSWREIAEFIDRWNGSWNIYYSANEPEPNTFKARYDQQGISNIRALYIDVDPERGVPFETARRELDREAESSQSVPLPPSVTIHSGGGNQMLWLLSEKIDARDGGMVRARAQGQALRNIYGGDSVHSIDHIMRLPGPTNIPTPAKREAGRVEQSAKILFQNARRYKLEDFENGIAQVAPGGASNTDPNPFIQAAFNDIDLDSARAVGSFDDLDADLQERFKAACEASKRLASLWDGDGRYLKEDKTGSGWRMCLAHELARSTTVTFTPQDFTELVHVWKLIGNAHDLPLREFARAWGKASAAADAAAKERASHFEEVTEGSSDETPRKRPLITIRAGDLASIATEAEAALIAAGVPFFKRGGVLVRPIADSVPAAKGKRATILRTVQVSKESITDHLARVADWQKFDERKNRMVRANPPSQVAEIILSRDGEWRFKELAGVIGTQTLRPDLSLLSEPGRDEATALWLGDPPAMPDLPQKPTRAQAEEALALLNGLLRDFVFVTEADRSVALSMLMTPIVRGAMSCAPMHAVRAPTPGSGKSFLVDLAAALATGQPCPVISPHAEEKELEKRLGGALLDGQSLVSIDNLNGAVSGDALCQMIERPLVQIRPLGVSKLVRIENKHTVFATGNNLNLVGDIVRRTVLCTLDTGLERPEMRPFQGDPVDTVRADRGKYIAAVLTIVLAYKEAGFPGKRRDLGSFEQWSEIVRSPLIWLGCADPVVTMENARAEDPVLSSLSAVMNAWRDSIGLDIPLSAGDLKASAQMSVHPDLHAALLSVAGDKSGIDAVRLGRWLSKYKGRIVGGMLFESQWGTNAKQNVWILKKSAGVAGVSGCVSSLRGKTVRLDNSNNTHTPDSFLEGSENTPANTRITRTDILAEPIGVFA